MHAAGRQTLEASETNVAVVERAFKAFSERKLEDWLELADPEIEFFPSGTAALAREGRPYSGHDGIRAYFLDVARAWEELRVVPQAYREAGDHVLVRGRIYARAAGGLLVDSPANWVWRVRDGMIVWACAYTDKDLEAAEPG
jgi:ketosteroid isomerase-like protein